MMIKNVIKLRLKKGTHSDKFLGSLPAVDIAVSGIPRQFFILLRIGHYEVRAVSNLKRQPISGAAGRKKNTE